MVLHVGYISIIGTNEFCTSGEAESVFSMLESLPIKEGH